MDPAERHARLSGDALGDNVGLRVDLLGVLAQELLRPRRLAGNAAPRDVPGGDEVPNDVGLRTRLSELQGRASDGDRAFHAALGATEGAAAQAGAAESESWVEAQQALSRLESTREPTTRALSDLDQLALSRADMPTSDEDNALLDAAREWIERLAAAQQQRVDRLRSRLGSR